MKRRTVSPVFLIIALLLMVLIFALSARDGVESASDSGRVGMMLGSLLFRDFESWSPDEQAAFAAAADHAIRKTAHACEYALLGFLWFMALSPREKSFRRFAAAFVISALYAVSDEVHQYFVPGRSCMLSDVLLDSAGSLVGVFAAALLAWLSARRNNRKQNRNPKNS